MEKDRRTNKTGISNKYKYEGAVFGNLTVLKYINAREVVCRCNCPNHTLIVTRKYKLDNGSITSCGCMSEHSINRNTYEKIKTTEFEVMEYINATNIVCKCSCGKTFKTTKTHIDNKEVHSCGCRQHVIDYDKQYKTNHKGNLDIIRHVGYGIYECKCKCGNTCFRNKNQLDSTENPSCGCTHNAPRGRSESNLDLLDRIYKYIVNNKGKTIKEIAVNLGVSYSTIQKAIHTLNIEDSVFYNDPISYEEKEVRELIRKTGLESIYNTRSVISPLELDIYIPEKRVAIEFNGNYWHSNKYLESDYHRDKTMLCTQKGIRLIHIFEYEWTNSIKRKIIESIVNESLANSTKLDTKDIEIIEIENNEYMTFCTNNHIHGYTKASIMLGCYYNKHLIGIMSFEKSIKDDNTYDLRRLCWKNGIYVVGGSKKIFKYFVTKYKPKLVTASCDISKFTGKEYTELGFRITGITEPQYVWTKNEFNKTLTQYQTQKHKLIAQGLGTENQTEDEIMTNLGYIKVYDCGNLKFEWEA